MRRTSLTIRYSFRAHALDLEFTIHPHLSFAQLAEDRVLLLNLNDIELAAAQARRCVLDDAALEIDDAALERYGSLFHHRILVGFIGIMMDKMIGDQVPKACSGPT